MYNRRVLFGGDPAPQSGGESTDAMMAAMIKNLPDLTRVTGENILPFERARLEASKAITPEENQLAYDTYRQFGPLLNQIGNQIMQQNQLAAVNADTAALARARETGLVDQALALQRQADPEFYRLREQSAKKASELLDASGGPGLSPTELEEIARGLNRTNVAAGVNDIGSPTAAVRNALTFGQAGQNRRNTLSTALAATNQVMQGVRSNFDPFLVSTGRSAFAGNTGESKFAGSQSNNLGQGTMQLSTNLLQQAGENQRLSQQLNSQRRDSLDRFNQTFGNVMQGIGGLAGGIKAFCWVAREVYGEHNPAWRQFRLWMQTKAPAQLRRFYIAYGEKIAKSIRTMPRVKACLRILMDKVIKQK